MTGRVAPGSRGGARAFDTDELAFDPSAGAVALRDEPEPSDPVPHITRSAVADADAVRSDHR